MSVQSMSWALEQRDIKDPTARYVLLCLANYADKQGKGAFPSTNSLSADTGLAVRTVRYKLDLLEEIGAICRGNQAIAAAYIDRHDRRPVVYDLCIQRGAPDAPGEERGANDDATGCSSRQNGVQDTTERGAPAAANPPINHPLSINNPKEKGDATRSEELFVKFWTLYPNKKDKLKSAAEWKKLKLTDDLINQIFDGLARARVSPDWTKLKGRYVPHPSTWLRNRRWEDEVAPPDSDGPPPGNIHPFPSKSRAADFDESDTDLSWMENLRK